MWIWRVSCKDWHLRCNPGKTENREKPESKPLSWHPDGRFLPSKKFSRTVADRRMSSLGICGELLNSAASLPRGVIGNTAGFGPAIQGSSPCGVAWAAMPEPVGACSRVFTGFFCAPVLLWHPVFACVLPPESYGRHLWSFGLRGSLPIFTDGWPCRTIGPVVFGDLQVMPFCHR